MPDTTREIEQRIASLERRLRRGRAMWAAILLAGSAAFIIALRAPQEEPPQQPRQKFTEIDVERINIVEPDGRLAMVIANRPRLPDVIVGGVEHDTGRQGTRGPGMLFFNHLGDESGGLTYSTREMPDGRYRAGAHFSFDQYRNDQVVFLSYADDGTTRRGGLSVMDRPTHPNIEEILEMRSAMQEATDEERARMEVELREAMQKGELGAMRVFIGSDDRTAALRLKDTRGNDRIRISVDAEDHPSIEFLDAEGNVVHRIPQEESEG